MEFHTSSWRIHPAPSRLPTADCHPIVFDGEGREWSPAAPVSFVENSAEKVAELFSQQRSLLSTVIRLRIPSCACSAMLEAEAVLLEHVSCKSDAIFGRHVPASELRLMWASPLHGSSAEQYQNLECTVPGRHHAELPETTLEVNGVREAMNALPLVQERADSIQGSTLHCTFLMSAPSVSPTRRLIKPALSCQAFSFSIPSPTPARRQGEERRRG